MPDDIREIVEATVETVKIQKLRPLIGEATPMTKEMAKTYKDTNQDINQSLKPGERFLTPAEATANRKRIIAARKEQGLPIV